MLQDIIKSKIRLIMRKINSEYKFISSHFIFAIIFSFIALSLLTTFKSKKLSIVEVREKCIIEAQDFEKFYYNYMSKKDIIVKIPSTSYIQYNCKSIYDTKIVELETQLKNTMTNISIYTDTIKMLERNIQDQRKVLNLNMSTVNHMLDSCSTSIDILVKGNTIGKN